MAVQVHSALEGVERPVHRGHHGMAGGKAETAVSGIGLVGARELVEHFDGDGNAHC